VPPGGGTVLLVEAQSLCLLVEAQSRSGDARQVDAACVPRHVTRVGVLFSSKYPLSDQ